MIILENSRLQVEIAEHGAELMRIYDRARDTELLWNGDAKFWKRRSPVLFPYVGKTWQGKVLIDGEIYAPSAHGFARDRDFTVEHSDAESATFLLASDADTHKVYPFDFELRIGYRLTENALQIHWNVRNASDREMVFTIGGHPAFVFADPTDKKDDYYLKFRLSDAKEELVCSLLDLATGTTTDQFETVALENGCLPLSEELFAGDTLIMDGEQVLGVDLCHKDGTRRIGVTCEGFPNFGVWSMPGAPFVCLEPWMGRCDSVGFDRELREKPNVNLLAPGAAFTADYDIVLP